MFELEIWSTCPCMYIAVIYIISHSSVVLIFKDRILLEVSLVLQLVCLVHCPLPLPYVGKSFNLQAIAIHDLFHGMELNKVSISEPSIVEIQLL